MEVLGVGRAAAYRRLPFLVVALLCWAARGSAWGQGACPGVASVPVYVENLSADTPLSIQLDGELVDGASTCTGAGATAYSVQLTCQGHGLVACGAIPNLQPGQWVNRIHVGVAGSQEQSQAQRAVFGASTAVNRLVWRVFPRTFVVTDTTEAALRSQLDAAAAYTAANPGPALVTFARAAFPGAGAPQRIDLPRGPCPIDPRRPAAALCVAGSRIVVDALDDAARTGGVIWSVGTRAQSVLRVYGADDVFRGLVFEGSQTASPTAQSDVVVFAGAAAVRSRLEQSTVLGPSSGDGVSVQDDAGGTLDPADAIVIDRSELSGARDRGVIVTNRGRAAVRSSCLHDNRGGGLQVTAGGGLVAERNVVQHNLPGAGKGIAAIGSGAPESSTLATDGNIVRFEGARGISISDHADATLRNDYVADNQYVGVKVETTAASAGAVPHVDLRGAALVCNRNAGVSGTCQPQAGEEGVPCAVDADCCGIADGCCVSDPQCASPLRCQAPFPVGRGLTIAQGGGQGAPVVELGTLATPGRNAFNLNRSLATGANFFLNVPGGVSTPLENQWEHCGTGASCAAGDVLAFDVRLAAGAAADVGMPAGARVGTPVLTSVTPARPAAGEVVRVYGEGFNAIEGTTCGGTNGPASSCSVDDPAVRDRNKQTNATRLRIQTADGTVLQTVYPDAVTPAMVVFRMPFDCFAPLQLQVAKYDPNGVRLTATIPLCGGESCAGQPAGLPCDDGDACTTGDQCSGGAAGLCIGTPITCSGQCFTGACDAQLGCVPLPGTAACDDGNACTAGDHCSGTGTCVAGSPRTCTSACMTGSCDPALGCLPKPANTLCRISTGACDVSEYCDGTGGTCPPNALADAGTVCRAAAGPCDVAETCTGQSAACPVNVLASAGVECRAAAGVCDVAEQCTGTSAFCPLDRKRTDVCRPSAGVCDVAEQCDGVGNDCPPDALAPSTTVCRAAGGACDVAERCTGSDPSCPADAFANAATACSDGTACTAGDHCRGDADVCVAGDPLDCGGDCLTGLCDPAQGCVVKPSGSACLDDGDPCTGDVCRAGGRCEHPALIGVDALTCQVPQCTRPKLRRQLNKMSARIIEAVQTGKTPTPRKLKRFGTLLHRCLGVR